MPITDDTLAGLVADLSDALAAAGLVGRQRGGVVHGIFWAECSGRQEDGDWLELRFRHDPVACRVGAMLVIYRSLGHGGRIEQLHDRPWTYRTAPAEVAEEVRSAVVAWLSEAQLSA